MSHEGGDALEFKISLAAARVNAGLKQKEVCEIMRISETTLSNWENGKTAPSVSQFRELCELYKCPGDVIRLP